MSNTRSNSRLRSRVRGGRYGVSPNKQKVAEQFKIPAREREAYEREGDDWFDKPRLRRDPSKERPSHHRGFSLSPVVLTRDSQTKDPKDMDKSISMIYSHALLFSRITSTLLFITKCLLLVIAFLFIKSTIQGDNTVLLKTLGSCFEGDESSCYSKVESIFFPINEIAMLRWMTFRLADTNIEGSRNLFEISFPLIIDNPVIIPMAAIATAIAYGLLGYLHGFLIAVAATSKRADPQLRGKHS